jgi:hypothetical protein
MVKAEVPDASRPFNTFFEDRRDFPFNGEPIVIYHPQSANTDTQTMVMFRRSDVIVTGPVFRTDAYPLIEPENGGTVQGTIDTLNHILDLTVPSKALQEAGTYVIPAHGRISDEHDVVMYRDMVVIVADRIRAMAAKRMTLDQVKAARPTLDYDGRYDTAASPASGFIEAIYREVSSQPTGAPSAR